jgi:hypothetical protein
VNFTGFGLAGKCERFFLSWQADELLLEGQVRLSCAPGSDQVEMTAERLRLKVDLAAPTKPKNKMPPAERTSHSIVPVAH